MQFINQLRTYWDGLDMASRVRLGAALAVSVLALVGIAFWASNAPWQDLLSRRSYDELLAAAGSLDEQEIPYRITESGSLQVKADRLGTARAALKGSETTRGLADVSELRLGLTPDAQEWAFLRAREGDVARMISDIDGVSAARVNIVPRDEPLFAGEERPATASVFVRLRPGSRLSTGQVKAIANLTANAVDGLSSDGVTLVDQYGSLLAEGTVGDDTVAGDPKSLHEYGRRIERRHESSVTNALLPILGSTSAFSVTASVALDFTSSETTTRRIDNRGQALVSEQLEESTDSSAMNGGVPGVDANLPERGGAAAEGGNASQRSATTSNFIYPTVDEVQTRPAGGIQRLSVAVQVDDGRIASLAQAGGDPEQIKKRIEHAIQTAVGFDTARGDQVVVTFVPFAEPVWVEAAPASMMPPEIERNLPNVIALLGVLLLFAMVVRPLMRAATRSQPATEPEMAAMAAQVPSPEELQEAADADLANRLRSLVDNYEQVDASDLNKLVTRESVAAAQVLRRWQRGA